MSNHKSDITDDEVAAALCRPGYGWKYERMRKFLPTTHLTLEAGIWYKFMIHSISPTGHDNTCAYDKCLLLYCIIMEKTIDVGAIANTAILGAASRIGARLVFPGLLTKLMCHYRVPARTTDHSTHGRSLIGKTTVGRIRKNITESDSVASRQSTAASTTAAPTTAAPTATTTAPPATYAIPPIPPTATGYGSETWLQVLVETHTELVMKIEELGEAQKLLAENQKKLIDNQQQLVDSHKLFADRFGDFDRRSTRVWSYMRDWNRVTRRIHIRNEPMLGSELPMRFPSNIIPPQVRLPVPRPNVHAAEVPSTDPNIAGPSSQAAMPSVPSSAG